MASTRMRAPLLVVLLACVLAPAARAAAPDTPANVTAEGRSTAAVVRWTAPPGTVSRYELRLKRTSADAWAQTRSISSKAREHVVGKLVNGVSYTFSVRAVNADGAGPWSSDVRAVPVGPPAAATAVSGVLTGPPGEIRVRWTPAAEHPLMPVERWDIGYQTDTNTTVRLAASALPAGATEATITLPEGAKYTLLVRPAGPTGTGRWASAVLVSPRFTLPVLRIDTAGGAPVLDRETYVPAAGTLSGDAPWAGAVEIRGRGNSTWAQPKKPYRLRLGSATSLLGMPRSRHWVLLANFLDRSHVRTAVAFGLGAQTSLAWTPRERPVEVVLNGRYLGLYGLTEHVRVAPDRIAIDPLGPGDTAGDALTGGYHLELDIRWTPAEGPGFVTGKRFRMSLQDPEEPAPEQLAYIKGYVQGFEQRLFSAGFADPDTGYAALGDVGSFVDWYIATEYLRNNDAWHSSVNLVKPRLGKLRMGPLWDFDLSMGKPLPSRSSPPTGWWLRTQSAWYARLFADPAFAERVRARWRELRPAVASLPALIDARAAQVATAAAYDRKVWNYRETLAGEVAKVQAFLATRAAWFDTQFPAG